MFQAIPDGINADPEKYGRPNSVNKSDVTLFGTCSILGYATSLESNDSFAAYFSTSDTTELSTIALNIATCFATTCEQTRKPADCIEACTASKTLLNPEALDYKNSLMLCIDKLCSNTCSLPYVDPDVLGIRVRSSLTPFQTEKLFPQDHLLLFRFLFPILSKLCF